MAQPQHFVVEPQDSYALNGQQLAELSCLVGNKRGGLSWRKNEKWSIYKEEIGYQVARISVSVDQLSFDERRELFADANRTVNANDNYMDPIGGATSTVSNYTLQIRNVVLGDEGVYQCDVEAAEESASAPAAPELKSRWAKLTILQPPSVLRVRSRVFRNDEPLVEPDDQTQDATQVSVYLYVGAQIALRDAICVAAENARAAENQIHFEVEATNSFAKLHGQID